MSTFLPDSSQVVALSALAARRDALVHGAIVKELRSVTYRWRMRPALPTVEEIEAELEEVARPMGTSGRMCRGK